MVARKQNEYGIAHLLLPLLIVVILGAIVTGYFMMARQRNVPDISDYSLDLSVGADPFTYSYNLGLSFPEYKNAQAGERIAVPDLKIVSSNNNEIAVEVSSHYGKKTALCVIPEGCGAVIDSSKTITLPKSLLKPNGQTSLIIRAGEKSKNYTLSSDDYALILKDAAATLATVPFYPDRVAAAVVVYDGNGPQDAAQICKGYDATKITALLRAQKVAIASDIYPGIEKVHPRDVLVITQSNHVYNGEGDTVATLTAKDPNGCKIVLSGTDTSNL